MQTHPAPLRIFLLGSAHLEIEGRAPVHPLAKKEMWLLALLAMRPGRAVVREYLAGLLWPDCMEEDALFNLRRALNRLRKAMGPCADCVKGVKPRSLVLAQDGLWVDVVEFDRLAAETDPAKLAESVALYRAPLLQDCYEEWAQLERLPREFAYQRALETLATGAMDRQDWPEAERLIRLRIASDPLQEQPYRQLMSCLASGGNHAMAAAVYRDLRVRLRQEINSDPDLETQALHESIRQEARTAPKTPTIAANNQSPHPAPAAAQANDYSPLQSIPVPLTRLIGREEDVATVAAHLSAARMVTLLGTGGVGKTRLSLEVSREVSRTALARFPDGAVFVALAPIADDHLVLRTLANALEIAEEDGKSLEAVVRGRLRDRKMLIVLDNCEHLVKTCADLCRTLLTACPAIKILATSRQALGIFGEVAYPVAPLAMPYDRADSDGLEDYVKAQPSAALEYPSVQLFLERARQACPELRIGPTDLDAVASICRRLDGIPLAIELAASRVRALSLPQIAARLDDRFRLLRGGVRPENAHHQTLRALLDWSHRLLDEPEKRLFARLSVFAGGWTMEAVEAVCTDPDAELTGGIDAWDAAELLTALVDKSLVVVERRTGAVRYMMLETIREYAAEMLAALGEKDNVEERHSAYFAGLTERAKSSYRTPQQGEWADRLETEHDNLRAALAFCATPRTVEIAARRLAMACQLGWFWEMRYYWREGLDQILGALETGGEAAGLRYRIVGHNNAALLARHHSEADLQHSLMEKCVALCREFENTDMLAMALGSLADIRRSRADYAGARACYKEAVSLCGEESDNLAVRSGHYSGLGLLALDLGENEAALDYFQRGLRILETIGDRPNEVSARGNVGIALLRTGDLPAARSALEQALELSREFGMRHEAALLLPVLGKVAAQQGALNEAREIISHAVRLNRNIESAWHSIELIERVLPLCMALGRYETAARLLGCAEENRRKADLRLSPGARADLESATKGLEEKLGSRYESSIEAGRRLSLNDGFELILTINSL